MTEEITGGHWLPSFLQPPAAAEQINDPQEIKRLYAHYRPRILFWSTVGYGTFYFVRKNLSVAMPIMQQQLGLSKSKLGLILTLHGVIYGISKFGGGIVADRANARIFMSMALLASAIVNIFFGLSSSLVLLGGLWMVNGLVQGLGYPPCARLLTHWFSPKELATKMSFWNISHSLGGGTIVVLCGYLVKHYGDWRVCFFIPSVIAVTMSALLFTYLRDTPASVGLPEIEGTHVTGGDTGAESAAQFKAFLSRQVFQNKYIWLVSIANFFVYTIRFAVFDWGPTVLKEAKGLNIVDASWMIFGFEIAGLVGMIVTGYLTDRIFKGRGAPLCLISMILCGVSVFLFWKTPGKMFLLNIVLLMATGFFVYTPQALVAVIVANLATKRAAATAVGLTSIFGYASTVISGWGMGFVAQKYGWPPVFACLIGVAAIGAILFAAALPAKANGYGENQDGPGRAGFPVVPVAVEKEAT